MKSTVRNLLLASLATGALATGAFAADAAAGKALYATKCKNCHGPDGVPTAGMVKAMGMKPLSDPAIQAESDGPLKDAILKGKGKMKAQAVSSGEADNLIAYVRTLK